MSDGPPDSWSVAVGVAHIFDCTVNDVGADRPPSNRAFIAMCASGERWSSRAAGVAQGCPKPDPLAAMRGTNGGRGETAPFRIEPELGKVGEDVWETVPNKSGDVLQEDVARSHVSNDPGNVWPDPSLIIDTSTFPRSAEWLAGETGSDEIHASAPRCAVEGREIVPDRRLIQGRLAHPGHEDGRCVAVPFNVSHSAGGDSGESGDEFEPSIAGAQVEGGKFGTWSHVTSPPRVGAGRLGSGTAATWR